MAININKQEGDKLHAEEWNELAQEVMGKQPRLNIVDDLNSDSSVDVLSAKQGKILDEKINSATNTIEGISEKIDKLPTGYYYGQFDSVSGLPDVSQSTQKGYAYVASEDPSIYYIYLFDGEGSSWEDSGNKFVTTALEDDLSTKSESKAPTTKVVAEGIEGVDLRRERTTALTATQKYNASANINDRAAVVADVTNEVKALGYKVLNPALSFAEQVENVVDNNVVIVDNRNTIFEIRDEFDLKSESVTIPANCTLKFNGGKITNGTIVGNHTTIDAPDVQIFAQGVYKCKGYSTAQTTAWNTPGRVYKVVGGHVTIGGTWDNESPKGEWVGLLSMEENVDASPAIMNFVRLHADKAIIKIPKRIYGIFSEINLTGKTFDAQGATFNLLAVSDVYDDTIEIPAGNYPLSSTMFPQGIAPLNYPIRVGHNGRLYNLIIDGENQTFGSTGTYYHQVNGIYCLVGALGSKAIVSGCTIKNSLQNGILDLSYGDFVIENTVFDTTIEHCIYGRPQTRGGGIGYIRGCTFKDWYNEETHRGSAKAVKVVQGDDIVGGGMTLCIEDCKLERSSQVNPKSGYCIGAAKTFITRSDLGSYNLILTYSDGTVSDGSKANYVTIDSCLGKGYIQRTTKALNGITVTSTNCAIVDFKNCHELATIVLEYARKIDTCTLNWEYWNGIDYRSNVRVNGNNDNRNLEIVNTKFAGQPPSTITAVVDILGAYNITLDNVVFEEAFENNGTSSDGNRGVQFTIKPDTKNVDEEGRDLKLTIINCKFSFSHMNFPPIRAGLYDVSIINSTFSGKIKSGYTQHYVVFSEFKTMTLNNVTSLPWSDGSIINVYRLTSSNSVTEVNNKYIASGQTLNNFGNETLGWRRPAKGSSCYDVKKNTQVYWNGTTFQSSFMFTVGTIDTIPTPTADEICRGYYLTDKHIMAVWSGSLWYDPSGKSPFIQAAKLTMYGYPDSQMNLLRIKELDDNIADTTLTFSTDVDWITNIAIKSGTTDTVKGSVLVNSGTTSRTATITITQGSGNNTSSRSFTVTQPPLAVVATPASATINANGGEITFTGGNAGTAPWTGVTSDSDWVTLSPIDATTTPRTVVATVAQNTSSQSRIATLTFTGSNTLTKTVTITQNGITE